MTEPEPSATADAASRLNEYIAAQPSSPAKTQAFIDLNATLLREKATLLREKAALLREKAALEDQL